MLIQYRVWHGPPTHPAALGPVGDDRASHRDETVSQRAISRYGIYDKDSIAPAKPKKA